MRLLLFWDENGTNSLWAFSFVPFFVDEEAGDAARARVDVFVGTKYSKINTPVVQREGHVSHSMRKIPSTDTTLKSKTVSTRRKNKEVEEE